MADPPKLVAQYKSSLRDLTRSSKEKIRHLTDLAEEYVKIADLIADTIKKHFHKVPSNIKLPVLQLVGSILIRRSIRSEYRPLFMPYLVSMFCTTFKRADKTQRSKMCEMRKTWSALLPSAEKKMLDVGVIAMDPAWPFRPPSRPASTGITRQVAESPASSAYSPYISETPSSLASVGTPSIPPTPDSIAVYSPYVAIATSELTESIPFPDLMKDILRVRQLEQENQALLKQRMQHQQCKENVTATEDINSAYSPRTAATTPSVSATSNETELIPSTSDPNKDTMKIQKLEQKNQELLRQRLQHQQRKETCTAAEDDNTACSSHIAATTPSVSTPSDKTASTPSTSDAAEDDLRIKKLQQQNLELLKQHKQNQEENGIAPKEFNDKMDDFANFLSVALAARLDTVSQNIVRYEAAVPVAAKAEEDKSHERSPSLIGKERDVSTSPSRKRGSEANGDESPPKKSKNETPNELSESHQLLSSLEPTAPKRSSSHGTFGSKSNSGSFKSVSSNRGKESCSRQCEMTFEPISSDSDQCFSEEESTKESGPLRTETPVFNSASRSHKEVLSRTSVLGNQSTCSLDSIKEPSHQAEMGAHSSSDTQHISTNASQNPVPESDVLDPAISPPWTLSSEDSSRSSSPDTLVRDDDDNNDDEHLFSKSRSDIAQANPKLLKRCAKDVMYQIPIDGIQVDVRFIGETPIIFQTDDDPREIRFGDGCRNVVFDGKDSIRLKLNGEAVPLEVDGKVHKIRLGVPTRELYINGKGFRLEWNMDPVPITICGKKHLVKLEGEMPPIVICDETRLDLVAGKVNLTVDKELVIPIYLDHKMQRFDIDGIPYILQFKSSLKTMVLNDKVMMTDFGGKPKSLCLFGSKKLLWLSELPKGIVPGDVELFGMKDFLPNSPDDPSSAITISSGLSEDELPLPESPCAQKEISENTDSTLEHSKVSSQEVELPVAGKRRKSSALIINSETSSCDENVSPLTVNSLQDNVDNVINSVVAGNFSPAETPASGNSLVNEEVESSDESGDSEDETSRAYLYKRMLLDINEHIIEDLEVHFNQFSPAVNLQTLDQYSSNHEIPKDFRDNKVNFNEFSKLANKNLSVTTEDFEKFKGVMGSIVVPLFHGVSFTRLQYSCSQRGRIAKKLAPILSKLLGSLDCSEGGSLLDENEKIKINIHSKTATATAGMRSLHDLMTASQEDLEKLNGADEKVHKFLKSKFKSNKFKEAMQHYIFDFSKNGSTKKFWDLLNDGDLNEDIAQSHFPIIATSKTPDHPIWFALGTNFKATKNGKQPLKPNYKEGKPSHRLAGLVYVTMHPLDELISLKNKGAVMDVYQAVKKRKIAEGHGLARLKHQNEVDFLGKINSNRIVAVIPVCYPHVRKDNLMTTSYHQEIYGINLKAKDSTSMSPASLRRKLNPLTKKKFLDSIMMPTVVNLANGMAAASAKRKKQLLCMITRDNQLQKYELHLDRKGNQSEAKRVLNQRADEPTTRFWERVALKFCGEEMSRDDDTDDEMEPNDCSYDGDDEDCGDNGREKSVKDGNNIPDNDSNDSGNGESDRNNQSGSSHSRSRSRSSSRSGSHSSSRSRSRSGSRSSSGSRNRSGSHCSSQSRSDSNTDNDKISDKNDTGVISIDDTDDDSDINSSNIFKDRSVSSPDITPFHRVRVVSKAGTSNAKILTNRHDNDTDSDSDDDISSRNNSRSTSNHAKKNAFQKCSRRNRHDIKSDLDDKDDDIDKKGDINKDIDIEFITLDDSDDDNDSIINNDRSIFSPIPPIQNLCSGNQAGSSNEWR